MTGASLEGPGVSRRPGQRRILLGSAVLGLVIVVSSVGVALRNDGRDGGPLAPGSEGVTMRGTTAEIGDRVTFGGVTLVNTGSRAAVLEGVSFEPSLPTQLTFLGARVASDPHRKLHSVAVAQQFPPNDPEIGPLEDLKGFDLPPLANNGDDRGVPILMGFSYDAPGVASFRAVRVDYRVGSRKFRATFEDGFVVCGPAADFPGNCPDYDELYPAGSAAGQRTARPTIGWASEPRAGEPSRGASPKGKTAPSEPAIQ